ncbi:MAG: hypothetical protein PVSMB4_16190 [Ktedonobacterales bacterium]
MREDLRHSTLWTAPDPIPRCFSRTDVGERTGSALDARRTYYHVEKLRPRVSPFGLMIRTTIDRGHMLLREPREP